MEHVIEAAGLEKAFPSHKALKGIDFKVPAGSIYGFLGPNGAGKTTTIKIILGLIAASSGRLKVLGEEVRFGTENNFLHRVGYLPQDPVFPAGLNGRELLQLVVGLYNKDAEQYAPRLEELISEFQLEDAARRKISSYSRGMKQRLGLAAVFLVEPDLLILDEPVSALDPEGRRRVLDLIAGLKGRSTVFFSSHILDDVERVCSHATIIHQGVKMMETTIKELLQSFAIEQYIVKVAPQQQEKARELLRERYWIRKVEEREGSLLLTSQPGAMGELAENVLPLLINNNILVMEFKHRQADLEEVFFRVLQNNGPGGEGS